MTALASLLAVVAIGLVVAWLVGSLVLRAGGLFIVVAGLSLELGVGTPALLLGALAWLVGHWIYAFRHHEYRALVRGVSKLKFRFGHVVGGGATLWQIRSAYCRTADR